MRIDAHQHFWSTARGDYGWLGPHLPTLWRDFAPDDLAPLLASHMIDATVLVQAAPSVADTDFMLEIASQVPWVGAVVGWIDFAEPGHRRHLERWTRHKKFRGVRPMLQDIADPAWILDARHAWVFDALAELDLHFEVLGTPRHLETVATLLRRTPKLPVVLDHALKPAIRDGAFEPWAAHMAGLAHETSALCKLSGLVTEANPGWVLADLKPYVDHVVASFGPDRIMWGSDWPVVNLNGSYDSWQAVTMALIGAHPGARAMLGGTAQKFYRIEVVPAPACP
jgi:L-fuconolactonase